MNYQQICYQAIEIIKEVGLQILNDQKLFDAKKVETKGLHDFVSYVDKNAEQKLVESFSKLIPGSGFIAEEQTVRDTKSELTWIIDPLDGTTNFIHGLAPFAISVALSEGNKTVIGIIYEITRDEIFFAWKDSSAFLNGSEISVSTTGFVKDSLIATGFPYYNYQRLSQFMNTLDFFMRNSHGLRRLGSAATDLAYVACGRFDAFYEYSLSPWDVAAGAFIVQQAGGRVCDFSGKDDYIFGKEIIASNASIFDEFLNNVKSFM